MVKLLHKFRKKISGNKLLLSIFRTVLLIFPVHSQYEINRNLRSPYSKLETDNKIIFIHIPKAAGNAVTKALYGVSATGHDLLQRYYDYDSGRFNQSYKFAVVRNPWDRLVSSYFYLKQGGIGFFDTIFADRYLDKINTFDEFISHLDNDLKFREKILSWVHFVPQSDFLKLNGAVDNNEVHILKLENVNEEIPHLCDKLGLEPVELQKVNQSKRNAYQDYYDDYRREIVAEIYSEDIKFFNYQFESSIKDGKS